MFLINSVNHNINALIYVLIWYLVFIFFYLMFTPMPSRSIRDAGAEEEIVS